MDISGPHFMGSMQFSIDSSKLSATADFHPMLKSYVNLGYVREYFHTFTCPAHRTYPSVRE